MNEPEVTIRPVSESDRPMLAWLIAELWGSEHVAVHGTVLRPAELPGFIAERSRRIVGLLTYQLIGDMLEIVTLNAIERRVGIGTLLIEAAASTARHFQCREVRLTTTNDNVDALRFYQRRGFRLAELRPGAVDRSRQEKPQIPRTGDYGIPLHDEIDLTLPIYPLPRRGRSTRCRAGAGLPAAAPGPVYPLPRRDRSTRCRAGTRLSVPRHISTTLPALNHSPPQANGIDATLVSL